MRNHFIFAAIFLVAAGTPLAAATVPAKAQPPSSQVGDKKIAAPQPTAALPAAPPPAAPSAPFSGDVFIRGAMVALQTLNRGGAAGVYDGASATMRRAISKEQFLASANASNARAGEVTSREWTRVDRLFVEAPASGGAAPPVPPGLYVTVHLVAIGAGGQAHVEQVSFRQDEDHSWRLSGLTTFAPEAVQR